jgi:hypothetical protein
MQDHIHIDMRTKPKERKVSETTTQSADVQAYEKDLVNRAVRWARENTDVCDDFTAAMEELFPGVVAVDSDGVDCHGNTVRFLNGNGVDAAKVKADTIASVLDKAIRLARQYPHVISADHARVAINAVFPGVRVVDSDGKGL